MSPTSSSSDDESEEEDDEEDEEEEEEEDEEDEDDEDEEEEAEVLGRGPADGNPSSAGPLPLLSAFSEPMHKHTICFFGTPGTAAR